MPRPRKVTNATDEAWIRSWWARRCAMPTMKQVCDRFGIGPDTVKRIARNGHPLRGNVADVEELARQLVSRETRGTTQKQMGDECTPLSP